MAADALGSSYGYGFVHFDTEEAKAMTVAVFKFFRAGSSRRHRQAEQHGSGWQENSGSLLALIRFCLCTATGVLVRESEGGVFKQWASQAEPKAAQQALSSEALRISQICTSSASRRTGRRSNSHFSCHALFYNSKDAQTNASSMEGQNRRHQQKSLMGRQPRSMVHYGWVFNT